LKYLKSFRKKGHTGRALANKLIDQIELIKNTAGPRLPAIIGVENWTFIAGWSQSLPEMKVPGSNISLGSFIQFVKEFFGRAPTRIVGEVFFEKGQLYFTIRLSGKPATTISGKVENIDAVLLQAAQHIYKYTQPLILASYLYILASDSKDIDNRACLETIQQYLVSRELTENHAWAYGLWGVILSDQGNLSEALKKFQEAITINPRFLLAYNNWGNALQELKDYEGAISMYKKAIDLDPKHARAYNNWGLLLEEQKDYDGAIAKYQKATEINPKYAGAYKNWGNVLHAQKDYDSAISKRAFEKVIRLEFEPAVWS